MREVENKISVESEGERFDLNWRYQGEVEGDTRVGQRKGAQSLSHAKEIAQYMLTVNSMGTVSLLYTTMLRAVYSDP